MWKSQINRFDLLLAHAESIDRTDYFKISANLARSLLIKTTSHKRNGVPNYHQLLFYSLLMLSTRKTAKLCITGPLWRESSVMGGFPAAQIIYMLWRHIHNVNLFRFVDPTDWFDLPTGQARAMPSNDFNPRMSHTCYPRCFYQHICVFVFSGIELDLFEHDRGSSALKMHKTHIKPVCLAQGKRKSLKGTLNWTNSNPFVNLCENIKLIAF